MPIRYSVFVNYIINGPLSMLRFLLEKNQQRALLNNSQPSLKKHRQRNQSTLIVHMILRRNQRLLLTHKNKKIAFLRKKTPI